MKLETLYPMHIHGIHQTWHKRLDADGTNYDMLIIEFIGTFGNNSIGYQENGILVIANRSAYMFRKNTYLSLDYLMEKLRIPSQTDAKHFKEILTELKLVK